MLVIIELKDITSVQNNDGSVRMFQEFLFSDPLEAGRVNVTKFDAERLTQLRDLKDKKVLIGLEHRTTDTGIRYWSITRPPVLAAPTSKPAA
jgi:hypothetical protein